ncbi:Thg1 C terminal domain-containing protein [Scheffersomyces coipomensis]|uniref:Thg1 C terminal domain-containing protein n=1 Tax=Scheffersomyces coipomensis TaxID=1788519 RepID=UPI00315D0B5C
MAKSRFEYVREFERENHLLQETYIVIRIDGKGFHKFSQIYEFDKPNDITAIEVLNSAALEIFKQIPDVVFAYGQSDEYSFLLKKNCKLYERREMKLITLFSSLITSAYMYHWNLTHPTNPISIEKKLPVFDARAVIYPNFDVVKDYFRWRQADCHINNLYNTTFWALVLKGEGMTTKDAETYLNGTFSKDKNEILFSKFGINYNNEPEIYKKGTIIIRELNETIMKKDIQHQQPGEEGEVSNRQLQRLEKIVKKAEIKTYHQDLITDEEFWSSRPWLSM